MSLIHLVTGDADLLVERRVQAVEAEGLARCGLPAFNHGTWDAGDAGAEQAVTTARTVPMMADLRVVVLKRIEDANDALLAALVDYAASPSPSTVLVITGRKFPKVAAGGTDWGRQLRAAVKKVGKVHALSARDVTPAAFARDCARELGKDLGAREAQLLVEVVGTDLGRLAQEVDKVATYVGGAPRITGADISAACSVVAEAVVWDLTAGVAGKRADVALPALHRLLADGDSPHRLLGLITWQLRDVLQVADMVRRGVPDRDIRGAVKMRADTFRRVRGLIGPRSPGPAEVLEKIAQANRAMNHHRAGGQRILEALVLDLCS